MPLDPQSISLERPDHPPRPRPAFDFVHLVVRSNFSFLQGASAPATLVQTAAERGYDVMALTDKDGLYGAVRAYEEAKREGIRLVVGCELTLDPEEGETWQTSLGVPRPTLVVHVENQAGYTNLAKILTESHARHPKGKPRDPKDGVAKNCFAGIPLSYVAGHAEGLWATLPMPDPAYERRGIDTDAFAATVRDAFGRKASLAVHRHYQSGDRARIRDVRERAMRFGIDVVATNAVLYARRSDKRVLDVLHCIREGVTLDQAGRMLTPNAEAYLRSEPEVRRGLSRFADHEAWLTRSRIIADACTFDLKSLHYSFPFELEEPAFAGETHDQALRRLTLEGVKTRVKKLTPEIEARIEHELAVIARMKVAPYFLSVRYVVDIAKRRSILCQGRGSAANSVVCFCLGITAVDPSESNMLFERFLSEERREPPDIDVDFEHDRREEVIQELYARYGRDRAAMVSEVISYRGKSSLREVGKAFGMSLEQSDRLSGLVEWWDKLSEVDGKKLDKAGFDPNDGRVVMALSMARAIQGFPRHLSIHVGGFVLSAAPLSEVSPVEPATMANRTVIPWDKDDIDVLGFFKVDVLGLGMLTALRKSLALLQNDPRVTAPSPADQLAKVPREDPRVYRALCQADTVGVFQIESRAQMSMLPRLRPKEFYDLVIEVAIVRPGPIQGDMVHPYLRRRNHEESSDPPHPVLKPILERTLGVPLFQEQVMEIAIVGAGYSGGEADRLRRDMTGWRKTGNLPRHKEKLRQGFLANGIREEFIEKLYKQIEGFGEYGFPESHAASFALLVYVSAWVKVHHPAEFAVGLLNSQPMGFYSPATLLNDAERHGVVLHPVSVCHSDWDSSIEEGGIRVGLRVIKGLGETSGRRIEETRRQCLFTSTEELETRAGLTPKEMELLAETGALEGLTKGRREAIWEVQAPRGEGLFDGEDLGGKAPKLPPLSRAQQLAFDYQRTGLSTSGHPMALARTTLPEHVKSSRDLTTMKQGARVSAGGVVICRQHPQTAKGVVFITMEDEHGFINLILYSSVFEALRNVATAFPFLIAHGIIERDGEVIYIVVQRLEPLVTPALGHRFDGISASRDFH